MSVSTSAAFFELLKESDILSPEELTRAEELVGDEQDTRRAARALVKADVLTRWQASQLLKGSPLLSLGKYVLLDRLPWGSNHAVFLATHPMMDRKVALNILDRASSGRADSRESFISDARAIAALDHRHLIHVFDIDEAEKRCFLVMEYVDGQNLHDTVKQQGPLSIEVAADIVRQIADGLSEAHQKKLIHGGLRPTNVIVDDEGVAKVIDLGLSKFDDLSQRPAGKEDDSKILGIADFLSPEQASGKLPTPATDIYSLGCIAYFLLTGEAPFTGGSYTQRLQRHQHDETPDVRKARKDVPNGLSQIIAKMMSKEPGDRFASAQEIVSELESWWNEYGPTIAFQKPKPKPVAAPRPAPQKNSDSNVKPPVAAAPPPKKNGKSSRPTEAREENGFPGIEVGQARPKAPADAPKADPAEKPAPQKAPQPVAKKPTGTPTKAPAPESGAENPEPAATEKKGLPLPLILAGVGGLLLLFVIGGLLFLFVIEGGGLAAYFLLGSDDETPPVAVNDSVNKNANQTGDDSEPASISDNEEERGTDPANEPTEDDEQGLPPPGGEPADGSGSDPVGEEPQAADPPEDNAGDGEEEPVKPEPPAPPDEPEPPKDPKPPKNGDDKPPKNEKPPKPQNPFRALVAAVELPPISGEAEPAALGTIHLPEEMACYIDLLGGEQTAPKNDSIFTFERARNGLADREWELKLEDDGNALVVATMKLEGTDLKFQWTPEAEKHDASAFVCNCALNLRTAEHESYVALRKPQQVDALVVNLEKPTVRQKLEIDNAPDFSTLSVEIIKIDGHDKVNYVPKQVLGVAEKDSTIAWLGEAADHLLGFKFDTVMQRDLQVTMTVVVDGGAQPVIFNGPQLAGIYQNETLVKTQLEESVKKMKQQRDKFKKQLPPAEQRLSLANQTIEKLDKLKEQAGKANGAAVHFRVYRAAGNHNVDIVQGTIAPEVADKAE